MSPILIYTMGKPDPRKSFLGANRFFTLKKSDLM